ncbi:UvrD-helicase domain-containing protein [Natronorarus salvus]|uniref:UvrD-helicase domain-containing protein n=1 Tax=Natronorarus salvus TaxID=3117733 RepID=UPI002F26B299
MSERTDLDDEFESGSNSESDSGSDYGEKRETESEDESESAGFELTEEQKTALELDRNLAITAGAGTGKTTTLTQRYLRILEERPDTSPSEIITITFTEDATTDLRRKIREAIAEKLDTAGPSEYQTWREYKDDLEDAYIHTIHAFCARLLREHITDVPVKPDFDTLDETDADLLSREVVRRTVEHLLDSDGPDIERLARLWKRSQLEDILVSLIDERPVSVHWLDRWEDSTEEEYLEYIWERFHPVTPERAKTVFEDPRIDAAFTSLRELARVGPDVDDGDAGWERAKRLLDIETSYAPFEEQTAILEKQWALNDLADALTTSDGEVYGQDYRYFGAKSRWNEESERQQLEDSVSVILNHLDPASIDYLEDAAIERNSAPYVLALARVFRTVFTAYEEEKAERNALDYHDLIEITVRFLRTNSTVRSELRGRFTFAMVDEMQDTDLLQWELIRLLATPDGESFDPEALNVFLVGDEKQSIYSFRGADVTTFATAREELLGSSDVDTELSSNFRTVSPTLEFLNGLFEHVFSPEGEEYEPFEAKPQPLTEARIDGSEIDGTVEYLVVPDDDIEALHEPGYLESAPQFEDSGERQAHAIAARLTRLFDKPPMVYDEETKQSRPAEPRDVAILLRTRNRLKAYERALDTFDIPYVTISGTGFYDTPEITALINLLRVLENPHDEIALYGILRSPLFGFTDETLAELFIEPAGSESELDESDTERTDPEKRTLWSALETADGELRKAYELLCEWRICAATSGTPSETSTLPWGRLLSLVIDETGYLAAIGADERPRQAAVNVNRFREQLRSWEEGGVKTASQLLTLIERRLEVDSHAGEATIPEDSDGVEIRTVHSSKGLQFPIVVVPDLDQQFNQRRAIDGNGQVYFNSVSPDQSDVSEPLVGIKAPDPSDPYKKSDTIARRAVKREADRRERAEYRRTLYVALTRVRDHLIFSGVSELEFGEDRRIQFETFDESSEAKCWQAWVQPVVCPSESEILTSLPDTYATELTLDGARYTVRLPPRPVAEWRAIDTEDTKASPMIEVPVPPAYETPRILSATQYCKHVAADASDDIFAHEPAKESAATSAGEPTQTDYDGLSPTTFGTIVHRLCERRPPRSDRRDRVYQLSEGAGEKPTESDIEQILEQTTRAIEHVDTYHASDSVLSTHDELSVRAQFEAHEIVGDIDHLIVTPESYHIIDYKTNSLSQRTSSELARYYWPQLEAYAVALNQNDPSKDVKLSLYFTEESTAETRVVPAAELHTLRTEIETTLTQLLGTR